MPCTLSLSIIWTGVAFAQSEIIQPADPLPLSLALSLAIPAAAVVIWFIMNFWDPHKHKRAARNRAFSDDGSQQASSNDDAPV